MEILTDGSRNFNGEWRRVSLTYRDEENRVITYRYSILEHLKDGSIVVSHFTPSGRYFKETGFKSSQYETAWRFMWRTALGGR